MREEYQSTSGEDLLRFIDPLQASVVRYSDLQNMESLPILPMFLLYEMIPSNGHWCLVFEAKDEDGGDCIEFFDPYGLIIDKPRDWVKNKLWKHQSGQDRTQLIRLLLESGKNITYSNDAVQDIKNEKIATCGRHCALRVGYPTLDAKTYTDNLRDLARKMEITPDRLVSKYVV